jgi:hypothetical protein
MSTTYERPKPCGATAEEISAFAEKLAAFLDFKPGSDLEPVVERLKGKFEELPFTERDSRKASITVKKGGEFTIRLPLILFPLQKRMLIAHELGHLFLHSRYGEVALEAYHGAEGKNETVEDEAHEFACAFLMPTQLLRHVAGVFKNDSIEVAAYFMVPEPVARQRMIDIG